MSELDEECAIQVLHHRLLGEQQPILAAVGPLQYEVSVARPEGEYGATLELPATPYTEATAPTPPHRPESATEDHARLNHGWLISINPRKCG